MNKPAELSAALALGWSLLLTLGLLSVAITVSTLFGASNLALVVAGPVELLLMYPAARFIAKLYGDRDLRQAFALGPVSPVAALAVGMLLSVAVVVPFAEELYFRGALFGGLQRSGPAFVAIWTTSIAFALAHQEPRNWAPLLMVALVLGTLRSLGGSIWSGVALHAAFNAATLSFVFLNRPQSVKPQEGSWQLAVIGCVLTAFGVWLFGRVAGRRLTEATGR